MADYWGTKVGGFRVKVVVTHTQNVANNTTTFTQNNYLVVDAGWSISDYNTTIGASVRGSSTYSWGPGHKSYGAGTHWISGGTKTITHASDGTLSGSAVVATINFPSPGYNLSASGTHTVDTIPRATTATWDVQDTKHVGTTQRLNLPRASSGFTHDVTYTLGAKSGVIGTGLATYVDWAIPVDLLTEFPNSLTGPGTITTVTKSGSTVIGSKPSVFSLTARATDVPTISTVVWDDANPVVKTNVGAFVQGESLVKGAITALGLHGSTITDKTLTVAGQTFTESQTFQPSTAGTITASGTVKDSRNQTATKAADFTVLAYSAPSLSQLTQVRRATTAAGEVGDGAYLRIDLTAAVASLKPSTVEKNSLKLRVRTRPQGGAWTTRNNITHTGLSYSASVVMVAGGAAFATVTTFDVEITITDILGKTTSVVYPVGTTGAALDLADTGTGHGKIWERGAIDAGPGGIYDDGNRVINKTLTGLLDHFNISSASLALGSGPVSGYGAGESSVLFRNATDPSANAIEFLWDGTGAASRLLELRKNGDIFGLAGQLAVRGKDGIPFATAAGRVVISLSSQVGATATVTLPVSRFTRAPVVVPGRGSGGMAKFIPYSDSVTATSMTVGVFAGDGLPGTGNATVNWTATQMTATSAEG